MKLEFKNRIRKYMEQPKDISIIEIKESDEIYEDIEFLDYDLNYEKKGILYIKEQIYFQQKILMEKMHHVLVEELLK